MGESNPRYSWWRDSKLMLVVELAIFAAIFVADLLGHIPFSKTVFLLLLALLSWFAANIGWREIGFRAWRGWALTILVGVLAGVGMEALELYVTQPALIHLTGQQPDFSDFAQLKGNTQLLLIGLALVWTLAAFGEEMVYRGYLLNRLRDLFAPAREGTVVALIVMSAAFGMAHAYQGITGIIDEGLMGLILGLLYVGFGGNLWVPIIAHGVQDSIDALLIYSGNYPGLS